MSRLGIVTSTAIAALTLLPSNVLAQQTIKERLQGSWSLVSCDAKIPPCVNSSGSMGLSGSTGRYTIVLTAKDRPKVAPFGGD
jgi:hypothetical protein